MDAHRFDRFARYLAALPDRRLSRRAALRAGSVGLAGAALGTAGLGVAGLRAAQDATPPPPAVTSAAGMPGMTGAAGTPSLAPANGTLTVRKNGKHLTASEKQAFVDALLALKQKPSPWATGLSIYDTFVMWHRDAFDCGLMAAHMGPAFFPWHRMLLHLFEQQLRAVDPSVSIPYWDWTVDNQKDSYLWHDDLMGGDGDPSAGYVVTNGPFRKGKWMIQIFDYGDDVKNPSIIRDFGGGALAPNLPTAAEVEAALNVATYDAAPWNSLSPIAESFRNTLEGWRDCVEEICDPVNGMSPTCTGPHPLHNGVHLWVSGEFALAHEVELLQKFEQSEAATPAATPTPPTPESSTKILGTMAANSSNSDPVFYMHHSNIDRLWSEWLRRHGPTYLPVSGGPVGHNLNDPMWPYSHIGLTITPKMMLDSRALGYVYDTEA